MIPGIGFAVFQLNLILSDAHFWLTIAVGRVHHEAQ